MVWIDAIYVFSLFTLYRDIWRQLMEARVPRCLRLKYKSLLEGAAVYCATVDSASDSFEHKILWTVLKEMRHVIGAAWVTWSKYTSWIIRKQLVVINYEGAIVKQCQIALLITSPYYCMLFLRVVVDHFIYCYCKYHCKWRIHKIASSYVHDYIWLSNYLNRKATLYL